MRARSRLCRQANTLARGSGPFRNKRRKKRKEKVLCDDDLMQLFTTWRILCVFIWDGNIWIIPRGIYKNINCMYFESSLIELVQSDVMRCAYNDGSTIVSSIPEHQTLLNGNEKERKELNKYNEDILI